MNGLSFSSLGIELWHWKWKWKKERKRYVFWLQRTCRDEGTLHDSRSRGSMERKWRRDAAADGLHHQGQSVFFLIACNSIPIYLQTRNVPPSSTRLAIDPANRYRMRNFRPTAKRGRQNVNWRAANSTLRGAEDNHAREPFRFNWITFHSKIKREFISTKLSCLITLKLSWDC